MLFQRILVAVASATFLSACVSDLTRVQSEEFDDPLYGSQYRTGPAKFSVGTVSADNEIYDTINLIYIDGDQVTIRSSFDGDVWSELNFQTYRSPRPSYPTLAAWGDGSLTAAWINGGGRSNESRVLSGDLVVLGLNQDGVAPSLLANGDVFADGPIESRGRFLTPALATNGNETWLAVLEINSNRRTMDLRFLNAVGPGGGPEIDSNAFSGGALALRTATLDLGSHCDQYTVIPEGDINVKYEDEYPRRHVNPPLDIVVTPAGEVFVGTYLNGECDQVRGFHAALFQYDPATETASLVHTRPVPGSGEQFAFDSGVHHETSGAVSGDGQVHFVFSHRANREGYAGETVVLSYGPPGVVEVEVISEINYATVDLQFTPARITIFSQPLPDTLYFIGALEEGPSNFHRAYRALDANVGFTTPSISTALEFVTSVTLEGLNPLNVEASLCLDGERMETEILYEETGDPWDGISTLRWVTDSWGSSCDRPVPPLSLLPGEQ